MFGYWLFVNVVEVLVVVVVLIVVLFIMFVVRDFVVIVFFLRFV